MNAVTPIPLTLPDGVTRELRFTLGARKRIQDRLGLDLNSALQKYDAGALPDILYSLMHDAKGNPPLDITPNELAETLGTDSTVEIMAAIMSAATQGKLSKNVLEPIILDVLRKQQLLTGSNSGALELDVLASLMNNSGGDTSNAKLEPESSDGNSKNDAGTTASVQ